MVNRDYTYSCSKYSEGYHSLEMLFARFLPSPNRFLHQIFSSVSHFRSFQDDKIPENRKRTSNSSVLEFRRRHSSLEANTQLNASIILRPIIFRKNFRPSAMKPRDYVKTNCMKTSLLRVSFNRTSFRYRW